MQTPTSSDCHENILYCFCCFRDETVVDAEEKSTVDEPTPTPFQQIGKSP